jgi:hypothetical protein
MLGCGLLWMLDVLLLAKNSPDEQQATPLLLRGVHEGGYLFLAWVLSG